MCTVTDIMYKDVQLGLKLESRVVTPSLVSLYDLVGSVLFLFIVLLLVLAIVLLKSLASASGRGHLGAAGWLSRPDSFGNLNIALRAQVGLRRDLGVAVCWFCGT
jgi:hypothetical protein